MLMSAVIPETWVLQAKLRDMEQKLQGQDSSGDNALMERKQRGRDINGNLQHNVLQRGSGYAKI